MKIKQGFLYIADLNPRVGSEMGKLRPVLVMQNDLMNGFEHPSTMVLPCSTRLTGDNALRVVLPKGVAQNSQECEVMIDQLRAIDNVRFRKLLAAVPQAILTEVKEKLRAVLDL